MVQWHVVPGMTQQTTELSPTGAGLRDVEKVTYQIDSGPAAGTQRTVTIPIELYTAENVKAAIEQDVTNVDSVASLKS